LILQDGSTVQATIEPGGNIHYFGAPGQYSGGGAGVYELNILNGQTREVAPDEISDFGTQSQFGGLLSQESDFGKNYRDQFTGKKLGNYAPVDISRAIIGTDADISGRSVGMNVFNFQGSSALLQGAASVRDKLAQEQAAREAAMRSAAQLAQAATMFNLNQTPVRQVASNGAPVRQLTVTPLRTPTINKVTVATPQQHLAPVKTSSSGLGVSNVSGSFLQGGNSIRL
jgi:hypothetical protein